MSTEQLLPGLQEMLPHEPTSLPSWTPEPPKCKGARHCEDPWRRGRWAGGTPWLLVLSSQNQFKHRATALSEEGHVLPEMARKAGEPSGRKRALSTWKDEEDFNKQDRDLVEEARQAKV